MSIGSNLWKLYIFQVFRYLLFIEAVLVPFFTDWGGINLFQISLIQAWFVICVTLLEIPTGAVADHLGRKTSIALGVLANIAAVLIYAASPNFYVFLLAETFWALAYALTSGADEALFYDSLKELGEEKRSKRLLPRFTSFALLGFMIAGPIGSWIAAEYGLVAAMRAMVFPLAISFFIALTLKEPKYKAKETKRYIQVLKEGVRQFMANKVLRILAIDSISVTVLMFFIVWIYQPLLLDLGLALVLLGFVHSLGALLEIAVMNNFDLLERLAGGRRRYVFFSAVVIGLLFLLLAFADHYLIAIPMVALIFGLGFTRKILLNNYMNKFMESKNRATTISTVSMLESVTRAAAYPIIGLLINYSLNISLLVIGILILSFSVFSRVEEHMLLD